MRVLLSVFGVLLSAFSVCCFLTLVFVFCFRQWLLLLYVLLSVLVSAVLCLVFAFLA